MSIGVDSVGAQILFKGMSLDDCRFLPGEQIAVNSDQAPSLHLALTVIPVVFCCFLWQFFHTSFRLKHWRKYPRIWLGISLPFLGIFFVFGILVGMFDAMSSCTKRLAFYVSMDYLFHILLFTLMIWHRYNVFGLNRSFLAVGFFGFIGLIGLIVCYGLVIGTGPFDFYKPILELDTDNQVLAHFHTYYSFKLVLAKQVLQIIINLVLAIGIVSALVKHYREYGLKSLIRKNKKSGLGWSLGASLFLIVTSSLILHDVSHGLWTLCFAASACGASYLALKPFHRLPPYHPLLCVNNSSSDHCKLKTTFSPSNPESGASQMTLVTSISGSSQLGNFGRSPSNI